MAVRFRSGIRYARVQTFVAGSVYPQCADACGIQRQSFGGGSVMVWGGITAHGSTPLVVVAGNLTGIHYRDEIVQPYVIPFIQAQANNVTFQQDNAQPHVA